MRYTRLWVVAAIIASIILVSFVFSVPHTKEVAIAPISPPATTIPTVIVHDTYRKGTHTITGSVLAPNPCTILSVTAVPIQGASASSTATGILVEVSLPTDVGVCLQEPLTMNFSTTINAPASLPITATVNGVTATTTLL
ncbi:MAG TPA: hypothetical protein VMV38_01420 [Candidatus Paceibacterota bacterium]|nr:hypothetical protein [Candidatus Paceibacterota bacterium]